MTALTGMEMGAEIAAGGRGATALSQGTVAGRGSGLGGIRAESATGSGALSVAAGERSFQSSWQSVMTAWGIGARSASAAGNGETDDGGTGSLAASVSGAAVQASVQAGRKDAPAVNGVLSTKIAAQASMGRVQQSDGVPDAIPDSLPNVRPLNTAWKTATGSDEGNADFPEADAAESNPAETDPAAVRTSTSGRNAHSGHSAKKGAQENVARTTNAGVETASLPMTAPIVEMPAAAMPRSSASVIGLAADTLRAASLPSSPFTADDLARDAAQEPVPAVGTTESTTTAQGDASDGLPATATAADTRSRVLIGQPVTSVYGGQLDAAKGAEELTHWAQRQSVGGQSAVPDAGGALTESSGYASTLASTNTSTTISAQASAEDSTHILAARQTQTESAPGVTKPTSALPASGILKQNRAGIRSISGTSSGGEAERNQPDADSVAQAGTTERTEPGAARPLHSVTAEQPGQTAIHAASVQQPGNMAEAAALVRDPAGPHASGSEMTNHSALSTAPPAGVGTQETFAALDSTSQPVPATWVHAGSQHAEAGFQDPALGWVGVRADLSGGGIHAALVPGSTDAAQALSGHLAGLSTYLEEQHTPVSTLTMAVPQGSLMDSGVGQGMEQSAGQNANQNASTESQARLPAGATAISNARGSGEVVQGGGMEAVAMAGNGRGMHISVMA